MNKIFTVSLTALVLAGCSMDESNKQSTAATDAENSVPAAAEQASRPDAQTQAIDKAAEVAKAREITKSFVTALKGELSKAMKAGGPVNAISVCSEKAIPIANQVSAEQGASVSRVSLKLRNPANKPDAWQTEVLQAFDQRAANGEDITTMGHAEIIEADGKKQLHFMKALPTAKLCLNCHGANLAPEVAAKLNELYPTDQATGYAENQVRGAVVVVKDIN